MLEYEFETVRCEMGGYSLLGGGVGLETEGHREVILRRAAEGWQYAGFLPKTQRGEGFIEAIDLIFQRQRPEENAYTIFRRREEGPYEPTAD